MKPIIILTEDHIIPESRKKSIKKLGAEDVPQEDLSRSDVLIVAKGNQCKVIKRKCDINPDIPLISMNNLGSFISEYLKGEKNYEQL